MTTTLTKEDTSASDLLAANDLNALYPVLDANRMTAGWFKKRPSLWAQPKTEYRPLHWRYAIGALALDQAGRWMDTEMAERRNLLLFNPVGDNDYDTVRTLVAAYQMVKPGEHARAHRHSPNALRLVLDAGPGCYTVVDGVKLPMSSGDLLLTPNNCWHSHFNDGDSNAYWIDVLDVPLVHRLEPMFVEHLPGGLQEVTCEPAQHPFAFSRASVQAQLDAAPSVGGVKRHRLNTADLLKTMAITYHQLADGAVDAHARNTASRICCVLQGGGRAHIGAQTFEFAHGDVLAVPSWTPYTFEADENTVLVEISDEPVLQMLGFYKKEK